MTVTFLQDAGTLVELHVRGGPGVEVSQVVIGAPSLELSVTETSQLTFTVSDPGLSLLRSGAFGLGTGVDFSDLRFEIAAVETGGGVGSATVAVTARSRGAQLLKNRKGALVVSSISPTDWVRQEAESVGLAFVGQASAVVPQVSRTAPKAGETDDAESSWDVVGRLAGELGYVAYEAVGVLYFGKPTWLVTRPELREWALRYPAGTAAEELSPVEVPVCRRTADGTPPVTVEVTVSFAEGGRLRPGDRVRLFGVPSFEEAYLVTSVSLSLNGVSDVTVSLAAPVDPEPRPATESTSYKEEPLQELVGALDEQTLVDAGAGAGADPFARVYEWAWPCAGHVSRKFGKGHGGIDLQNGRGTRVHATKDGYVHYVGQAIEDSKYVKVDDARGRVKVVNDANHGLTVDLSHDGGYHSLYQHLDKFVVKKGQRVKQGELLGFMGSSGLTQGWTNGKDGVIPAYLDLRTPDPSDTVVPATPVQPRLHFEIRLTGVFQDPLTFLPPYKDAFKPIPQKGSRKAQ